MKTLLVDLINEYYLMNRQVGHTTLLITSAQSPMLAPGQKPIVLCHNYMWAKELKKKFGVDTATIEDLRRGALRGQRRPLLVDNAVWLLVAEEVREALIEKAQDNQKEK